MLGIKLAVEKIKKILSAKVTSIAVIIFSMAGRVIQQVHFVNTSGDKISQIQATKNMIEGHGYTLLQVLPSNLSESGYFPLIKWPPGYSILLSPFYFIFREKFFWGSLCLDIITAVLFVWFVRKIIMLFNLKLYVVNFYTLVSGFFIYNFTYVSTSDFITLLFYIIALYLALKFLLFKQLTVAGLIMIAFLLFYCALLRYMYLPVSLVIPAYLIINGFFNRNRFVLSRGLIIFLITTVSMSVFLFVQGHYSGSMAYVGNTEKGFYPENFLRLNPFLFSPFVDMQFFLVQSEKFSGHPFSTIFLFLQRFHFIPFLLFIILSSSWLLRKKLKSQAIDDHYINIGILSSLIILIVLILLSITHRPIPNLNKMWNWSFVDEGRYYAFLTFFFQQLLFIAFFKYRSALKKWMRQVCRILLFLLSVSTMHGIYYTIKVVAGPPGSLYFSQKDIDLLDYSHVLLRKTIRENPGKEIIIHSSDPAFENYGALWENVAGLDDKIDFTEMQSKTDKEVIVFTVAVEEEDALLSLLRQNHQKDSIGHMANHYFYAINVKPVHQR